MKVCACLDSVQTTLSLNKFSFKFHFKLRKKFKPLDCGQAKTLGAHILKCKSDYDKPSAGHPRSFCVI